MAIYNDSFMDNATNIVQLISGVGSSSGDSFIIGYMTLFSFFIIFLIVGMRYDFLEVLMVDSFITTIITIIFFIAGFVPIGTISISLLVLIIALVFRLLMR